MWVRRWILLWEAFFIPEMELRCSLLALFTFNMLLFSKYNDHKWVAKRQKIKTCEGHRNLRLRKVYCWRSVTKIFLKNWNKGSTFLEPMSICRGRVNLQSGCVNVFFVPLFYGQAQFRINSHKAMTCVALTFSCHAAQHILHIFQ